MVGGRLTPEGCVKLAEMGSDEEKIRNSEALTKECLLVGGGDRYVCGF